MSCLSMLLFPFLLVTASSPTIPPIPPKDVDWRCLMCEDVLQTYHDKYHCVGQMLDLPPLRTISEVQLKACNSGQFSCTQLKGALQDACFAMEDYIAAQDVFPVSFFLGSVPDLPEPPNTLKDQKAAEIESAYSTCVTLEQCQPDPPPKSQLDETDPSILHPCHQTFLSECGDEWSCAAYTVNCEKECYLCTWVLRDWPRFQEYCKPKPAPPTVSPPTTKEGAFLEVDTSVADEDGADEDERIEAGFHQKNLGLQQPLQPEPTWRLSPWSNEPLPEGDADNENEAARVFGAVHKQSTIKLPPEATQSKFQKDKSARFEPGNVLIEQSAQTPTVQSELCYNFWKYARSSRKVGFFTMWLPFVSENADYLDRNEGSMWDANIACKCLGYCALGPFERLNLLSQCQYGETEDQSMRLVLGYSRLLPKNITAAPSVQSPLPTSQSFSRPVDVFMPS